MLYDEISSQTKTCGICNNKIDIREHLDGLVVNDEHFICKNCCINTKKVVLTNFVKDKSMPDGSVRSIMLWLWEQNR